MRNLCKENQLQCDLRDTAGTFASKHIVLAYSKAFAVLLFNTACYWTHKLNQSQFMHEMKILILVILQSVLLNYVEEIVWRNKGSSYRNHWELDSVNEYYTLEALYLTLIWTKVRTWRVLHNKPIMIFVLFLYPIILSAYVYLKVCCVFKFNTPIVITLL